MAIYGYARISTKNQNIDRQIRNILSSYPEATIIQEVYTGMTQVRPKWQKLLSRLQAHDKIVFDEVSRMARNADEGMRTYEDLYYKDIDLIFLKESHCNTEKYREALQRQISITIDTGDNAMDEFMQTLIGALNKLMMELAKKDIELAFLQAQKEVDYLHRRTSEGIETARRAGKQIGQRPGIKITTRKSMIAKEQIRKHNKSFGGSLTNEETWRLIGINKNTFYKYKRELEQEIV